jgi:S-adenosylmethionine-diacylglycerol 3-amino-3-carboxypropyl transferase
MHAAVEEVTMGAPYRFGLAQEDDRVDALALDLPGGHVLAIASAGEVPLSLLAAGAERVDAIDVDPGQLHLVHLKLAAVRCLEREEAIRFLGLLPASGAERERWLRGTWAVLPSASRAFWQEHGRAIRRGVIWSGRAEGLVRLMRLATWLAFGRDLPRLLSASTLAEQRAIAAPHCEARVLRATIRLAFHPALLRLGGMDPENLRGPGLSLPELSLERFRSLFTAILARDNPHVQLRARGQAPSPDCVPRYLTAEGFATLRARHRELTLIEGDLASRLAAAPGRYDRVQLSNVADWMSPSAFDDLLRLLTRVLRRPGRVLWRRIVVERPVPCELAAELVVDHALAARLAAIDRFPFFRLVPASLG